MLEGFDFLLFEEEDEWGLLSYTGDVIKRASYKEIIPFVKGNQYTYAKDGKEWILIDQKGEDTKKVDVETIDYGYNNGYSDYVISDYFDIDAEVKNLMSIFNEDGTIDKMTFGIMPGEFANLYNKDYKVSDLLGVNNVRTLIKSSNNVNIEIGVTYDKDVIAPNYEKKWVSNRWGGYYDNVVSGYSYNTEIEYGVLFCDYKFKGKFLDRKQDLFEAILNYWSNKGYSGGSANDSNTGKEFYMYDKEKNRIFIKFKSDNVLEIESVILRDY